MFHWALAGNIDSPEKTLPGYGEARRKEQEKEDLRGPASPDAEEDEEDQEEEQWTKRRMTGRRGLGWRGGRKKPLFVVRRGGKRRSRAGQGPGESAPADEDEEDEDEDDEFEPLRPPRRIPVYRKKDPGRHRHTLLHSSVCLLFYLPLSTPT